MARLVHLFEIHGIEMAVDQKAVDSLIDQAMADGFGARAKRNALGESQGLIAEIPQMLTSGIRRVVIDSGGDAGTAGVENPGDPGFDSGIGMALAHPIDAPQAVDCGGWSSAELKSRLEFLWKLLESTRPALNCKPFFKSNPASNERSKLCEAVPLHVPGAGVFILPGMHGAGVLRRRCSRGVPKPRGILTFLRYRRIVASEQKWTGAFASHAAA